MTPIIVVGRASSLCRDHGGTERMLGRALLPKGWTFMWLLQPPEDLTADANGRLLGVDFLHGKDPRRIVCFELGLELIAALRDRPHPSPLLVADLENLPYDLMCREVAAVGHHPTILVIHLGSSFFKLPDDSENPLQDIQRLEASDHDRNLVGCANRLILLVSHDRADMTGAQETLHPVLRRLQDGRDRRGDADVGDQKGEIVNPELTGLMNGHGIGWG